MIGALFYPLSYAPIQISNLVRGIIATYDTVDFPDEDGGDVDLALAVPFLPNMDAIVVTEARLVLRSSPRELDIEQYSISANGSEGVFLSLSEPSRLRKVELSYSYTAPPGAPTTRVVLRAATSNGTLQAGVPLFATPDFGKPGPMYGPTLGGMSVAELGNSRRLLSVPAVLGDAWLLQLASGADPTDLAAIGVAPEVKRVVLEALPRNLSVVLAPDGDAVVLWQNPGVLLPESGDQEINFAALAQKHLSAALASASAALAVPLRFHSDSAGAVLSVSRSLVAEYQVRPLGDTPRTLPLRGDLTPFVLNAPAGVKASRSSLRLTAKMLGRELNAGSPEPPLIPPSAGLRVGLEHWVATASSVAPRTGDASGSLIEIASLKVYLAVPETAEVVLEIRSDIAGTPGESVAAPLVKQLAAGGGAWREFELPTPLKVVAGNAPIWLLLRTNKGAVHWFAHPQSVPQAANDRVSTDRGSTWGVANPLLGVTGGLLLQIFHRVDDPLPAPGIRLQRGATILQSNLFANPTQKSPREYSVEGATLPPAVLDALAAQAGQARVDSEFLLFSSSALDLVVEALTLAYDPFGA